MAENESISGDKQNKRRFFSWKFFTIISVAICIMALPAMKMITNANEVNHRKTCINNMKMIDAVLKEFAKNNKNELFPMLSSEPGQLMFLNNSEDSETQLFPKYLSKSSSLICPGEKTKETCPFQIRHSTTVVISILDM